MGERIILIALGKVVQRTSSSVTSQMPYRQAQIVRIPQCDSLNMKCVLDEARELLFDRFLAVEKKDTSD